MKQEALSLMILVFAACISSVAADDDRRISFGVKVMFGGRYDNMRMCVASDTGVKGGIVADIMLNTRLEINENTSITLELPVMRPILFAAAFGMLQFEPEFTFEFKKEVREGLNLVFGPGIGASFHHGPDYHSSRKNRGESFLAIGPLFSGLFGFQFEGSSGRSGMLGLRPFYVPLFSGKSNLSPGTVLGGVFEGHFYFR